MDPYWSPRATDYYSLLNVDTRATTTDIKAVLATAEAKLGSSQPIIIHEAKVYSMEEFAEKVLALLTWIPVVFANHLPSRSGRHPRFFSIRLGERRTTKCMALSRQYGPTRPRTAAVTRLSRAIRRRWTFFLRQSWRSMFSASKLDSGAAATPLHTICR